MEIEAEMLAKTKRISELEVIIRSVFEIIEDFIGKDFKTARLKFYQGLSNRVSRASEALLRLQGKLSEIQKHSKH